jgi:hypothetical protein
VSGYPYGSRGTPGSPQGARRLRFRPGVGLEGSGPPGKGGGSGGL